MELAMLVEKFDTWLESVHCTRRENIASNILPHRFGKSRFISKEVRSSRNVIIEENKLNNTFIGLNES
ncbi:uncharacterized protein LOC122818733 isoform X4 [Drosophila biarmipes]|uniref:uncharacterized protein LOC122818733 isoform X4 n=1 Tax=Drosophila biarmipes TaxID=125945 RepID=UPI0021CCF2D2|nr:uncharacterized protein LOC122818733 isoform X4 [Drosophila biarmipes]